MTQWLDLTQICFPDEDLSTVITALHAESDYQGQGLGRNLVEKLMESAASSVLVLGDPAFYGRFGFQAEQEIKPPYAIPKEWAPAWQSVGC